MGLYMALSMGAEIEVPLNPPGVARFVYDKDNFVCTNGKVFMRTLRSKAAQQRRERDAKSAPQAMFGCPECEYERVTGDIQSQYKHTCQQAPEKEVEGIVATRGSLPPPLRSLSQGGRRSEGVAAAWGSWQRGGLGRRLLSRRRLERLAPMLNAREPVVEPPQGAKRSLRHARQLIDARVQLPQLATNVEVDRKCSFLVWD